jgi:hypothetical protein
LYFHANRARTVSGAVVGRHPVVHPRQLAVQLLEPVVPDRELLLRQRQLLVRPDQLLVLLDRVLERRDEQVQDLLAAGVHLVVVARERHLQRLGPVRHAERRRQQ